MRETSPFGDDMRGRSLPAFRQPSSRQSFTGVLFVAGLFHLACAAAPSPEERAVLGAVTAHFAASGIDAPVAPVSHLPPADGSDAVALERGCAPGLFGGDSFVDLGRVNSVRVRWSPGSIGWIDRLVHSAYDVDARPDDLLLISRPLFADDGRSALVLAERHCPLCGFGRYVILIRAPGGWAVVDECETWVS